MGDPKSGPNLLLITFPLYNTWSVPLYNTRLVQFIVMLGSKSLYQKPLNVFAAEATPGTYRGTSLIRNLAPLGPYRRPAPRVLGES